MASPSGPTTANSKPRLAGAIRQHNRRMSNDLHQHSIAPVNHPRVKGPLTCASDWDGYAPSRDGRDPQPHDLPPPLFNGAERPRSAEARSAREQDYLYVSISYVQNWRMNQP